VQGPAPLFLFFTAFEAGAKLSSTVLITYIHQNFLPRARAPAACDHGWWGVKKELDLSSAIGLDTV